MIIAWLERAVNLMATGCYMEAMTQLDLILVEVVKTYFVEREEVTSDEPPVAQLVEAVLGPVCVAPHAARNLATTREFLIMERAVLLQGDATQVWSSEVDVATITAVILYNKGLLYHVLGLRNEARLGDSLVMKARSFYEKALSLIQTCTPELGNNIWIKSVLFNNLGQISCYLCDRPGEQLFLTEMGKLLPHRNEHETMEGAVVDLELNVFLLVGVHRPSPAA